MKVTVGIPVYNGARYLGATLDSLLAQTLEDVEIVVCDNASTDGTEDLVRDYAARDPRIRYDRGETNRGAAYNYNRCVELARAPYFKWNAADDVCCRRVLEECVDELDAHPDAVLAYPRTRIIDGEGRPRQEYDDRLDLREADPAARFEAALHLVGECNAVFGVVRTDVLRGTARIEAYPGADVVLVTELALHGGLYRVPSATFFRRDHEAASSAAANRTVQSTLAFYDPQHPQRRWMRNWRHLRARWRALRRAPLTSRQRRRCARLLVRMAVTDRGKLWAELFDPWGRRRAPAEGPANGLAR